MCLIKYLLHLSLSLLHLHMKLKAQNYIILLIPNAHSVQNDQTSHYCSQNAFQSVLTQVYA